MTWSFVIVVIVAVITPGADTVVLLRNAAKSRAQGIAAVGGVATGQMLHACAAIGGLTFVLQASAAAFEMIRWFGVGYLLVLGLMSMHRSLRGTSSHPGLIRDQIQGLAAGYRMGLIANLANPKTTLFFASLLPQFMPGNATTPHLILAAGSVVAASIGWYLTLVLVAARASSRLDHPNVRRKFDAVFGAVFVGLSVRLAVAARS